MYLVSVVTGWEAADGFPHLRANLPHQWCFQWPRSTDKRFRRLQTLHSHCWLLVLLWGKMDPHYAFIDLSLSFVLIQLWQLHLCFPWYKLWNIVKMVAKAVNVGNVYVPFVSALQLLTLIKTFMSAWFLWGSLLGQDNTNHNALNIKCRRTLNEFV